jgi:alpha-tubulin suppressor-like RCC1 family protein
MRSLHRATAIAALTALSLCGAATTRAQVNGDATISGPSLNGTTLSVGTSSQYGGGISSIHWAGKEFINNWDHGRQMAPNFQYFNRFQCFNPYETGSWYDGKDPGTSSVLLSLSASGNRLESRTQMAWYLRERSSLIPEDFCGNPADWLCRDNQINPSLGNGAPCPPYTGPLSDYVLHKIVTIGFAGIPNVIEYLFEIYIPEPVLKGLHNPTAVLPYEFNSVRSWDVISKDYRNIRLLDGEDDRIKVVSTADGNHAMGWYSPEQLQPYDNPGTVTMWRVVPPDPNNPDPNNPGHPDPDFACVHIGGVNRHDGAGPGWFPWDRSYLVIGNLDQVKSSLASLHLQFRTLDPDVFNWRDYVAINGLQSLTSPHEAQTHWLNQGFSQGLRGSRTFSASQYLQLNPDVANGMGATNYQGAINHYVGTGRGEGRSTVSKPAAGMQHLLASTNRIVNASGQNVYGQLGTSTSPTPPSHIFSLDNTVTEVAAGDYTSFAVKNDGTLWVWGSNQYGARGDGTSGDNIADPVQVPLPNRVTTPSRRGKHAVAVGAGVYAAIDTEGQVWAWGVNWNGRLGDGSTASRYTPGRVRKGPNPNDYLTGIVSISAGGGTVAAIDADGNVWTWGAGANGALGNGSTQDSPYPVLVINKDSNTPLAGVSEVACGSSGFCIALVRYGAVFGWGNNQFSQLGTAAGGFASLATNIDIAPNIGIDAIAAGSAHAIAHSSNGNVYGWGYNGRGQLGIGSTSVAQAPPVVMNTGPDGMNNISDLAAGPNFSVMVRHTDRAVFVTGDNQSGQFGIPGSPAIQKVPIRSSF